jgi:putative flippase GtrA
MAIELSVISNLLLNEAWTFRDRRPSKPFWRRAVKFHIVSGIGATGQLMVFVVGNVLWMVVLYDPAAVDAYFAAHVGWFDRYLVHPFVDPPDVGKLMYVSQLAGIGAAMTWNFLANFYWTWRAPKEARA